MLNLTIVGVVVAVTSAGIVQSVSPTVPSTSANVPLLVSHSASLNTVGLFVVLSDVVEVTFSVRKSNPIVSSVAVAVPALVAVQVAIFRVLHCGNMAFFLEVAGRPACKRAPR